MPAADHLSLNGNTTAPLKAFILAAGGMVSTTRGRMASATGGRARRVPTIPAARSMLGCIRVGSALATATIFARAGTPFVVS